MLHDVQSVLSDWWPRNLKEYATDELKQLEKVVFRTLVWWSCDPLVITWKILRMKFPEWQFDGFGRCLNPYSRTVVKVVPRLDMVKAAFSVQSAREAIQNK